MGFVSFGFLGFLAAAVALFHLSPRAGWRRGVLALANLGFLATWVHTPHDALAMGGFVLGSFGLIRLSQRVGWRTLLVASLAALIGGLVWVKRYKLALAVLPADFFEPRLQLIGISYMTFKAVHVLVDAHQRQLAAVSLASYANYQLGFFSLVAGPMQPYPDFRAWWDRIEEPLASREGALRALSRVLHGLLQIGILAALAHGLWQQAIDGALLPEPRGAAALRLTTIFYAYPAYVYFNFSGYCDVVIGAAALLGMRHQENFDRPYLARNMVDFWDRWHISLTHFIRDYVFMTSYKAWAERWPRTARQGGYALLFGALLLAGIWHGSTWNFVIFGAIHGAGVAATRIWGDALRSLFGREGARRYDRDPWIRRAAVLATFHYACFSFLFFEPGFRPALERLAAIAAKVF
ncbi:MAG: MBOAT family O-acyltransferase [Myxococcota bacterium]